MAASHASRFASRTQALSICFATLVIVCCVALSFSPQTALASGSDTEYVIDEYGLFSADEYDDLDKAAREASSKLECDVYFLTVSDISNKSAREFAKDYYNRNELGAGSSRSGILFMIALDSRDYVTVTYGNATSIFTDYQINNIESNVVGYLSDGKWYKAAMEYFEDSERTIDYYDTHDEAIDRGSGSTGEAMGIGEKVLISLASALVIALVIAFALTRSGINAMKSARMQTTAFNYVKDSGVNLTASNDEFVTTTTVVIPLPDTNSNHPGGGSTIDMGGFGGSQGGKF